MKWLLRSLRRELDPKAAPSAAALEVLSSEDLLTIVFSNLGAEDLHSCARVCKKFRITATQDLLWSPLCEALWSNKLHVPVRSEASQPRREAFRQSLLDCTDIELSEETLCSFPWEFRFKHSAGEYWTSADPSWTGANGGKPLQRIFLANGEYRSLTTPDPFWTADNSFRWRITKSRQGKPGHFVKVNNYPSLEITRTEDWGYVMQNCWVVMNGPAPSASCSKN